MRRLSLLLILGVAEVAAAQESAPLVLRVPASARAAALGDAFTAGRGSEMVFYHPAQIGLTTGLSVSMARYRSAATAASLATSSPLGPVAIAAGVQWLDYRQQSGQLPDAARGAHALRRGVAELGRLRRCGDPVPRIALGRGRQVHRGAPR